MAMTSAAETIGGTLHTDMTLSAARSPYTVDEDLIVTSGATLSVEPGVELRFAAGVELRLGSPANGSGTLVARGTSKSPVLFTANVVPGTPPSAGDWSTVRFTPDAGDTFFDGDGEYASGSIVEYAVFEYAGGDGDDVGAITIDDATVMVSNVLIHQCGGHGIFADLSSTVSLDSLTLLDARIEGCSTVESGAGVYVNYGRSHRIRDCTFLKNTSRRRGGGLYMYEARESDVSGCTFVGNTNINALPGGVGGGAYILSDFGSVTGNTFSENMGEGAGAVWAALPEGVFARNSVTNNVCTNHGIGGVVVIGSGAEVSGNTVEENLGVGVGGASVQGNSLNVFDNVIRLNEAPEGVGGLDASFSLSQLTNNVISNNQGGFSAGGVLVHGDENDILENTIDENVLVGFGAGGIQVAGSANVLSANAIGGNSTTWRGGGVLISDGNYGIGLHGNEITNNVASERGGGIYWRDSSGSLAGERGGIRNLISENEAPLGSQLFFDSPFADGNGDVLDASWVDWGTEDPGEIESGIHDFFDEASLSFVVTTPYDTGPIMTDVLWMKSESPYRIDGGVIIGGDATLTIEPGTIIEMSQATTIWVGSDTFGAGTLVARGTPDDRILFTSDQPEDERERGDWGQIVFSEYARSAVFDAKTDEYVEGSILEHVDVEYGGFITQAERGVIRMKDCLVGLRSISVSDSQRSAIAATLLDDQSLRIHDARFARWTGDGGVQIIGGGHHTIANAVFSGPRQGPALTVESHGIAITNCDVINSGGAIEVDAELAQITDCNLIDSAALVVRAVTGEIQRNTLECSRGMHITQPDPFGSLLVSNNVVSRGFGGVELNGGPITFRDNEIRNMVSPQIGGGLCLSCSNCLVVDNLITGNVGGSRGGGIYLGGDNNRVERNVIASNQVLRYLGFFAEGGGIYVSSFNSTVVDNFIYGNFAEERGGGIYTKELVLPDAIVGNEIIGNVAELAGGGIMLEGGGTLESRDGGPNVVIDNESLIGSAMATRGGKDLNVDARGLCWGTTDVATIQDTIHDFYDDLSLGFIFFEPVADGAMCPDIAKCAGDIDSDGSVGHSDLLALLAAWGTCPDLPEPCAPDLSDDGIVDVQDLILLVANWGTCRGGG